MKFISEYLPSITRAMYSLTNLKSIFAHVREKFWEKIFKISYIL